ncbi:hypothetical protein B188_04490 [Candidatus Brocadiaceae bacterium B188]|nr:MAG: hypothetical protein IPI25_05550 [Candidatus Brocadia sp.]TWU52495.1 hypothetical protein B188_04490 [Candidatus Brocadiaceae bacterium B188]
MFEKLLYHNQFVMGPFFLEEFASWKRVKIHNSLHVMSHPNLNTVQAISENKSITLLGFILDPNNPHATDSDIINELIHKLFCCDTFIEHTFRFGGRWILIVNDGKTIRLFHDACGLRQVFYTDTVHTKDLWCASQPRIIAEILRLQFDPDAVDFINSYEFRNDQNFKFPCESSPYKEIKHLLPNHYLDLLTGQPKRYWPNKELDELPLNEAIEKISVSLKSLMKSASYRFDLALGLTSGWDSRLLLAASKEISDKISYITVRKVNMLDDHADVQIPSILLSNLKLKHDVVKSSYIISDEFIQAFKKNTSLAHDVYAPDAYAILKYSGQKKVAVTGGVSEAGRRSVRDMYCKPKKEKITAQDLSKIESMGNSQFAINNFEKWLLGLGDIHNVDTLTLFGWEQEHGTWHASSQLEFNIGWKDIFTPFNCRDILINMLSVKEKYRKSPKYLLYKKLILKLWPEVLSVPINPHKKKRFNSLIKSYIIKQLALHIPASFKSRLKRY